MQGLRARWMLGVSTAAIVGALLMALIVGSWSQAEQKPPSAAARDAHRFKAPTAGLGAEVTSRRTATSRTFRGPDGTLRTLVSPSPVNYRAADGAWRPIDTDLKPDGQGGLTSREAPSQVTLPATLEDPATVSDGSRSLTFALQGADAAAAQVDGPQATYDDALDGVDAAYQALATGVKETLTLADADAPSTFAFSLDPSAGLRPALQPDGAVVLRDGEGKIRFTIPAPTVKAADQPSATTDHVAYRLSDDGRTLTVAVDPQWLSGARFPVEVDPTIYAGGWDSCTLASGTLATTSGCNSQWLKIGHDSGHTYRSVLRFDNADIPVPVTASIVSAEVDLVIADQDDSSAITQVDAIGLDQQITGAATWSTYDGVNAWSSAGGDLATDPQPNPNWMVEDYIPGWVGFDVSALAERWIKHPESNNGVLLKATDEGADNVLTFGGQTYLDGGPTLVVTYRPQTGLRGDQTTTDIALDDTNSLHVNVASGNLATRAVDLQRPGAGGLDLTIGRVHNSGDLGDGNGVFGSGWTETVDGAAFVNSRVWYDDARTIYTDGGAAHRFDRDYANDSGTTMAYLTPPGIDAQLTADSATGEATLTYADGRVWTYAGSADGYRFTLSRIDDGQGHHIDLHPDSGEPYTLASITDANADTITFDHGVDGELTEITDPDDDTWTYTVDNDLLTEVEDPDSHTTSYTYATDPVDRLTQVTDVDGHTTDLDYDGDRIATITRHVDGDPDHDEVWHFDYTPDPSAGEPCDATVDGHDIIGRTVVTDPDDQETTYCYDDEPSVLQIPEPVTPPSSIAPPAISGDAIPGETVEASTGDWAGDAPTGYDYQWRRCDTDGEDCDDVDGATGASYAVTPDDSGSTLRVVVTATNAAGSDHATSAATDVVPPPVEPANAEVPTVDGTPRVDHELTASDGDWIGTRPLSFTYQWQRCDMYAAACSDIAGATAATYTPTADDDGRFLRVTVTATNVVGTDEATSAVTERVLMAPGLVDAPTIDGDAVDGARLTAARGGWTGTRPLATTYQWRRCDATGDDCVDIDGGTGPTYDVTSEDVDATLRVAVAVGNDAGDATAESDATDVVAASAPDNLVAPTAAGITQPGAILTARTGQWTGTPEITYTYAWSACDALGASCSPIAGATSDELELDESLTGSSVRVTVTATNDVGSTARTSAPTRVIGVFSARISGPARVGGTLTAVADQLLGRAPDFSYQWQHCDGSGSDCVDIDGATSHQLKLGAADAGHTIRVVIVADDGAGTVTGTSQVTVAVAAPAPVNVEQPAIAGRSIVGFDVSATDGEWSPGGVLTYQWSRCDIYGLSCAPIAGETGRDHLLTHDDLGMRMKVAVTATTTGGTQTVAARIGPLVTAPAVVNTELPTVTREPGPGGEALTTTNGAWEGDGELTYSYVWLLCDAAGGACEPIPGSDDATYSLHVKDVDRTVRVVVTAHTAAGVASARSAATAPIDSGTIGAVSDGTLVGDAKAGGLLSVEGATWTGVGPLAIVYQWERCSAAGTSCAPIADATDIAYTATGDDVGGTLRRVATASAPGGDAIETTPVSAVVAAADGAVSAPVPTASPTIAGTAAEGETLTASTGAWDAVGPLTYNYVWLRCDDAGGACAEIAGATGATHTATAADVGHALQVRVTAQDLTGAGVALATTATSIRAADGPVFETAPVVSGTVQAGATLSATEGTWSTAHGPLTYAIRWQRCGEDGACADLEDATGDTYAIEDEDAGVRLRVVVSAEDADGRTTSVVGERTAVVASALPTSDDAPTVSGTATSGATLHAGDGTWTGLTPMTPSYQWERCDADGEECEDIDGATDDDHLLTPDDVGATVRVTVVMANSAGEGAESSAVTTPVGAASGPTASAPPTIDGTPLENGTLTADPGTWSGTGTITYTYRWLLCSEEDADDCEPVQDATEATLLVTGDDVYSVLRVEVTAHDAAGTTTVRSDPTAAVASAEPETDVAIDNTVRPALGEARAGEALTADTGTWDAHGATLEHRYRWWTCDAAAAHCERLPDADGPAYTPSPDEVGLRLRVMVTAVSGDVSATIMSTPSEAVRPPRPTATVAPTVWGDAVDGAYLTSDAGTWIPDDVELAWQWQRCDAAGDACADVSEANGSDYWLTPDDIGHTIRFVVSGTNADGTGTAASAPSDVIAAAPPQAYVDPTVTGVARVDGALTADPGGWGGSPELTYTYVWERCDEEGEGCAPISGATAATYTLVTADLGARVRVTVTAHNDAGTASATSAATDVVDAAAVPAIDPGDPPAIDGAAHDGQVLTVAPGGWSGSSPLTYTYVWERCSAAGTACAAITGATAQAYTVTSADLGATLRAVVTAHNPTGTAQATTDTTAVVATGAPVSLEAPTVDGQWRAGGELVADAGRWGGSAPSTFTYQWRRCDAEGDDCADLTGETGDTYTLTEEDARRTIAVAVTATNAHGSATATSDPTAVGGLKPVNLTAPTISGTAHTGEWLTADPGTWQNEPDEYLYTWDICDQTGESCYSLTSDASFYVDDWFAGSRIRVTVTAADGWDDDPPTATSALTTVIGSSAPVNLTAPTLADETPSVGKPLAVDHGDWVGDGITYSYQWRRCLNGTCQDIFGENQAAFAPRWNDVGYTLYARVTGTTAYGSWTVSTDQSPEVIQVGPYNTVPPHLSGAAIVGAELTSDGGEWSDYWRVDVSWERCDAAGANCAAIPDSSGTAYRTVHADQGGTIRSVVVATGNGGRSTARSAPSAVIGAATKPAFATAPAITGVVAVGQTVDGGSPDVTGSADIFYSGQWERCAPSGEGCDPIEGADQWTYTVQRSDAGSVLRFDAAITNGWGSVSRMTAPTAVVPAVSSNVVNVTRPAFEDNPWSERYSVGDLIFADAGIWAGNPEHVTIQWQRCEPGGLNPISDTATCADIEGATGDRYNAVEADTGRRLRLKVTATSGDHRPITVYSELSAGVGIYVGASVDLVGPLAEGETVTSEKRIDPDDYLPTFVQYKWELSRWNEVVGRWVTKTVSRGASYTIPAGTADAQLLLHVYVSKTTPDGMPLGSYEAITAGTIQRALANTSAPVVTGSTTAAEELTTSDGGWTGGDGVRAYDHDWERCDAGGAGCVAIEGAHEATYKTTIDDVGHTVRSVVTAHAPGGYWGKEAPDGGVRRTARSAVVGPITVGDPPSSTEDPTVEGSPVEDEVLHATEGAWDGSGVISYTYQWQTCDRDADVCSDLGGHGADTPDYRVQDTDFGAYLRVVVKARNGMGAAIATSLALGPVEASGMPDPQAVPKVTSIGAPAPGATLVSDGGAWDHAKPDDLSYQWQRCDAAGAGCAAIDGATDRAYLLADEDTGHRLQVVVTATNDAGVASAISDPSDAIGATAAPSAEGKVAFVDSDRVKLGVSRPDGSDAHVLTSCGALHDVSPGNCEIVRPRLSGNLRAIAFEATDPSHPYGAGEIYVINVDGTGLRHVRKGSDPAWTPDDTQLLFTARDASGDGTRSLAVDAGGARPDDAERTVLDDGSDDAPGPGLRGLAPESELSVEGADMADDGRVAFVGRRDGRAGLYVSVSAEDLAPVKLALGANFEDLRDPRFTPDGRAIAFTADLADERGSGSSLWEVDADGGDLHRLSPPDGAQYGPASPTTAEVITTRRPWEGCDHPSFSGVTILNAENCSTAKGRGYAMNHDGSNPHFLGSDDALDVEKRGPKAHAAAEGHECSWHAAISRIDENLGEPSLYQSWSKDLTAIGSLECATFEETTTVSFKLCLKWRQVDHRPGEDYHSVGLTSHACEKYRGTVRTLLRKGLLLQASCTAAMQGDIEFRLRQSEFKVIGSKTGEGPTFSIGRGAVTTHCLSRGERFSSDARLWRRLADTTPATIGVGVTIKEGDPYSNLAGQMGTNGMPSSHPEWGGTPYVPRKAWSPHHVIPIGGEGSAAPARDAQAYAYRCHMHPNDRRNGIWLRRYKGPLTDGSSNLTDLRTLGNATEQAWANRAMHWSYKGTYGKKVTNAMRLPGLAPDTCRRSDSYMGWKALENNITSKLAVGQIPGIPKGRPGT